MDTLTSTTQSLYHFDVHVQGGIEDVQSGGFGILPNDRNVVKMLCFGVGLQDFPTITPQRFDKSLAGICRSLSPQDIFNKVSVHTQLEVTPFQVVVLVTGIVKKRKGVACEELDEVIISKL